MLKQLNKTIKNNTVQYSVENKLILVGCFFEWRGITKIKKLIYQVLTLPRLTLEQLEKNQLLLNEGKIEQTKTINFLDKIPITIEDYRIIDSNGNWKFIYVNNLMICPQDNSWTYNSVGIDKLSIFKLIKEFKIRYNKKEKANMRWILKHEGNRWLLKQIDKYLDWK